MVSHCFDVLGIGKLKCFRGCLDDCKNVSSSFAEIWPLDNVLSGDVERWETTGSGDVVRGWGEGIWLYIWYKLARESASRVGGKSILSKVYGNLNNVSEL